MWPFKKKEEKPRQKEYLLVKIVEVNGVRKNGDPNTLIDFYFYLYENKDRERWYETKSMGNYGKEQFGIYEFSRKVYPWTRGQDFDDIPSYWDKLNELREDGVKLIYKGFFYDKGD